jgi:hypothetical protein
MIAKTAWDRLLLMAVPALVNGLCGKAFQKSAVYLSYLPPAVAATSHLPVIYHPFADEV